MASYAKPKKNVKERVKSAAPSDEIGLSELVDWVNESDDASVEERGLAEKSRDYYNSKQWTAGEKSALEKRGQAATVINRVKPKINGLKGLEKQNRTTAKAYPRTPQHAQDAAAATEAVRFVLQDNFYIETRANAWDNMLVEGIGAVEVMAEEKKDGIRITINPMYWDRLIYDPHSRRRDFGDARYLGQMVWMDYDEALEKYPDAQDVLEAMMSGSSTYDDKPRWMDGRRRRVRVVEMYYRYRGEIWYACFTRGGFCEAPKVCPYMNEEGEHEWPYEFQSAFVDREGQRYGALKQLLDVQDEVNKRRSKALHLMSVRQVRLEKGAVDDVNKTRAELAKPDGVVETTAGMEFEVLKTGDMAAAQFNLLTEAKQEIDAVGFNAALSGKDENLQSGRALMQRAATGQTELAPLFDALKSLDLRVYRKVWNRVKQYWKAEQWIRVTDDERNLKWIGLNRRTTRGELALKKAQEQGLPPEQLQVVAAQIASDPAMAEPAIENDIASLDVDIVMADAPDAVTTQIEDFQVLGEMVKSGFPMPPIAVIEASPLSNKEKIIKMMQEEQPLPPAVQQKMRQIQEAVRALSEENQQLKSKSAETAAKLDQDGKEMRAKLFLQKEEQDAKLVLQKEKQDREAALAREKAESEFDLRRRQCDFDEEMSARENTRKDEEQGFKREMMAKDKQIEAESAVTPVLPAIVEKIEQSFAPFSQLIEVLSGIENAIHQSVALRQEEIRNPRRVSLGAITRDANGEISGATVIPQKPKTIN